MKNNHKINFKDFLSNNKAAQSCLVDIKNFASSYSEAALLHKVDEVNKRQRDLLESLVPSLFIGLKEKLSLSEKFVLIANRFTYIDNPEKFSDYDLVFCLDLNLNRYYRSENLFDISFSFLELKKFYNEFSHLCSSNGTVYFKETDGIFTVESAEVSAPSFSCNKKNEIENFIKLRLCSLTIISHFIDVLTNNKDIIESVCQAAKKQLELSRERELIFKNISINQKEAENAIKNIFNGYFRPAFRYDEAQHQLELFKARKIRELKVTECFIEFSAGSSDNFVSIELRDLYLTINKAGPASIKCYMTERDMEHECNPQVFNAKNMAQFEKRSENFFMQESDSGDCLMSLDLLRTMKDTLEVNF